MIIKIFAYLNCSYLYIYSTTTPYRMVAGAAATAAGGLLTPVQPVSSQATRLLVLLGIIAEHDLDLRSFDVKTAFLPLIFTEYIV